MRAHDPDGHTVEFAEGRRGHRGVTVNQARLTSGARNRRSERRQRTPSMNLHRQ
jgi:hypothetical protein